MSKIAKTQQEPQLKRMNLNVPLDLHNTFKSATASRGESMTDALLEFIQQYVADSSAAKPKGRRK